MTKGKSHEVLICGAGAAGLTLAIVLARRGVAFRIIEKQPEPFRGSRGKGIQPRTQEIFEDLGVIDRIVALGGTYPLQRVYGEVGSFVDSPAIELPEPTPAEPYQIPLLVPQFLTELGLRERLAELGHQVEYGTELCSFDHDGDGVTAILRVGEKDHSVRFSYLVGTDGGRSFVRHALKIDFPGKTLGVRALVVDVHLEGLDRDHWHRFGEGDMARQISICPLAGTDMFQIQGPIPLEGDIDLSAEGLTALLRDRTGLQELGVRSVSWSSAFNMNARLAERYRDGCVFIGGDAAHTHPPTGGQGLNTSVQDAYNLGWKLAAVVGGAPAGLLDTYEEERRPIAAQMLGLTTRLLEAAKAGAIRRGREVNQLDVGYSDSSLSYEPTGRKGGVLAGDRAPDIPLIGAGGLPVRLFQLLRGSHWSLIGKDVSDEARPPVRAGLHIHHTGPRGDIADVRNDLTSLYGLAKGEWVLIRPDGYIGGIFPAADRATLENYLHGVGLARG